MNGGTIAESKLRELHPVMPVCMSRCSDVIVAVKTNVMATSFTIIAVTRKTGYKTVTQDIRHKKDIDSLIGLSLIHPDVTSAK